MSDKELLELAAKAAGIELSIDPDGIMWKNPGDKYLIGFWNPLTDDGDALRLAVKLGIDVVHGEQSCVVNPQMMVSASTSEFRASTEFHGTDPQAATRRAIVRAAAEIGKATASDGEGL